MIRYRLRCGDGHDFDGWFRSSEAYEQQRDAGDIACMHCASTDVEKSPMAPAVSGEAKDAGGIPALSPADQVMASLRKLRREVEKNSDYVGDRFATEARAMHEGEKPHRSIHGEAKPEDAKQLIEDGVPIAPLPFAPRRKVN
ncbi:DUF1178 family protein [Paracoccus sp. TK19116]|uniref:DUF1178 family protein n=1 Tax=Paracoccus albicereus TaxID=2922394 RepID=A0ABT1MQW1_9RHOB|nr:DUF1178 family protein [Paracoccus albicereus]MCQ0970700.1 DUF1178 family protein [Paracoccus albicereus]